MRFVLTLHSHLPWVLHHGRWPHGSDWLSEATLDTYLPLLAMLERAGREGIPVHLTLGITPVLAAQFADGAFRDEIEAYFAHRLKAVAEAPASLTATGDEGLQPLVPFWREHLGTLKALWDRLDGDLIAAFRGHAEAGRVELISSAATHGFLPLLARDESIRLQLLVGRSEHLRHFGSLPRGCWLPECAYRPGGPWNPWPGAPARERRRGIEEHLRHAGFQWWFVDAHLAEAGEAFEVYEERPTRRVPTDDIRSPYRGYEVGSRPSRLARPMQVLVRDPETTAQVWSRHGGYPGDGRYLEFHKLRHPDGLRLWRVTDTTSDLGEKAPYDPAAARAARREHAGHFRRVLEAIAAGAGVADTAIVAPFDTELFGHWWFEGVDWLGDLHRELATTGTVVPSAAGAALAHDPPTTAIQMRSGSWGANGDFSKWLNDETAWTWRRLWALEDRFWNAVPAAMEHAVLEPVLEQAARELLLAQSSDWQFIISTGAAGDYATARFNGHCEALESLLPALELGWGDLDGTIATARALRQVDGPFPSLLGAIAAASDVTEP